MNLRFGATLVLFLASVGFADDVLVLKNGREARGRIVEETDAGVKLDIGGGKMFYAKDKISEVRRGAAETVPKEAAQPEAASTETREESALLYLDGRRVGTRTTRVAKVASGFRFEEEIVFLDAKEFPDVELRTTERCDEHFDPLSFSVREGVGETSHRMVTGEVRDGRLYVTVLLNGGKTSDESAMPGDARFPLAARELFVRESKTLCGKLELSVYDTRDLRFRKTTYSEGGRKMLVADGKTLDVRVIVRKRGDVVEHEWLEDSLRCRMAELNGETLRALSTAPDVVARVRRGDTERITGPDSAARTRYADAERGFKIGKPDPSWTFEPPSIPGAGALLSIRNIAVFASVDLMEDVSPPPDVTLERESEALQRVLRAIAPDLRVFADGFVAGPPLRYYQLEASATTKGQKTKTMARTILHKGKVYRLLAACPEEAYDALRSEFVKILDTFVID